MLPVFDRRTLLPGDLIFIVYVFGLARFTLSLAGLDSGAAFGALGSGREMFLHFLTEIGLILFAGALALRWGTTSLPAILDEHWRLGLINFLGKPDLIVLLLALAVLILFEAERIPVDNPASHLELTMAHPAIPLEYAGRDLVLEWGEAIKLTFLLALFGDIFLPFFQRLGPMSGATLLDAGVALFGFALRTGVLVLILAIWELSQPKLRLRAVVGPALVAMALSLIAMLYRLTLGR